MTIAIDLGRKAAKQTQKKPYQSDFILANSADTNEMFTYGAFHLGRHCFLKYLFTGIQNEKG